MLEQALDFIKSKTDICPRIGIVLGSGLADAFPVERETVVSYRDIPEFPVSTVAGHIGNFVFGYADGVPVVLMRGRVHYYEGYPMEQVVLPIRMMGCLGVSWLILTNAAGGIREDLSPGDIMIITDQITSFVPSPLIGRNDDRLGIRFPDMSRVYDEEKTALIQRAMQAEGLPVRTGVYLQTTGPQYETPAEIRMYRALGADAVGMSTACEAIAARHMGMTVSGLSGITNKAAGTEDRLKHEDVLARGAELSDKMGKLLNRMIRSKV